MPRICLEGVNKSMEKLNDPAQDGEVRFEESRGNENRYSYRYKNKLIFTFGYTRGSRKKEVDLSYVPRQMGLVNKDYFLFEECFRSKEWYNDLSDKDLLINKH